MEVALGEQRSIVLSSNTVTTLSSSSNETRSKLEFAIGRLNEGAVWYVQRIAFFSVRQEVLQS